MASGGMQTCQKQYKSATEMETHLSSYDHHHKKVRRLLPFECLVGESRRLLSFECLVGESTCP